MHLEIDEEFTAQYKEEYHALYHFGYEIVKVELGSNFACAALKEYQQRRYAKHYERIKLGKPGDYYGRGDRAVKPRPPAVLVEMVCPAPATAMKPAMPQIAPDIITVRIITRLTFIAA